MAYCISRIAMVQKFPESRYLENFQNIPQFYHQYVIVPSKFCHLKSCFIINNMYCACIVLLQQLQWELHAIAWNSTNCFYYCSITITSKFLLILWPETGLRTDPKWVSIIFLKMATQFTLETKCRTNAFEHINKKLSTVHNKIQFVL